MESLKARRLDRGAGLRPVLVALASILLLFGVATSQEGSTGGNSQDVQEEGNWEFRICAGPDNLPFSNEAQEGFENRIAEILANELGARLTYDWYPQGADMITYRLRAGRCDAIMGIPDGLGELLATVAYYRSPYVFVYRADSDFQIGSLDDPILQELEIAVQNTGIPPHEALVYRGLAGNVVTAYLEGEARIGAARSRAVVDAVIEQEVDVALVWGPVAGYLAQQNDTELVIEPVTPQFELPFRSQSFAMTIGMRPGDEALRDRLNIALGNRWEEVQQVLGEYAVPLEQIPAPFVTPPAAGVFPIGFVTPTITGSSVLPESLYDVVGEAARMGALLAEGDIGRQTADTGTGTEVRILFASTPTAQAAERAAERLLAVEGVRAMVGGLGDGQAEILAELATANQIPFMNLGSPLLPRACEPYVFHVEASAAMYLDALALWFGNLGASQWYVVHEEGEALNALVERAGEAIAQQGGEVVATSATQKGQPSYWQELQAVRDAHANAILLLLDPRDQIAFMGQEATARTSAILAPFPNPVTQAREYLAASRYTSQNANAHYRVLLWETTLEEDGASELNSSYTSRWGEPMDPSAWAAYQSVNILYQALVTTGVSDSGELVAYLESPDTSFRAGKGVPLAFHEETHQLRQPLYVVELDPQASWARVLSRKIAIANLAGQVPAAELIHERGAAALDSLGGSAAANQCSP